MEIDLPLFRCLRKGIFYILQIITRMMDEVDDDYEDMEAPLTPPAKRGDSELEYSEIYFGRSTTNHWSEKPAVSDEQVNEDSVLYSEVKVDKRDENAENDGDVSCSNLTDFNGGGSTSKSDTSSDKDYIEMNDSEYLKKKMAPRVCVKEIPKSSEPQLCRYSGGDYCTLQSYLKNQLVSAKQNESSRYKSKSSTENLLFTDVASIEDGKIVLITSCGEIVILAPDGKILLLEKFEAVFDKCTVIGKHEIAVSCGFQIRFFVLLEEEVKEEDERCIDFQYDSTTVHGLSYSMHTFAMSCNLQSVDSSQKPTIILYDMRRRSSRTIPTVRFVFPGEVLLSSDCKKIFVADQIKKTVTCLDDEGKVMWEITEQRNPVSLTLANNVLAVAYENFTNISCYQSSNGSFLDCIQIGPLVSTRTVLLANNLTHIIICPCEHSADQLFDLVVFVPLKNMKRNGFKKKLSKVLFHK